MSVLRRRGWPERGFTVIETLIILAIIGIAALFAAAYLRSIFKRERLKTSVRQIYAILLDTRMEAMRRNQNCVMLIDPTHRQITVWADALPYNSVQDPAEPTLISFVIPNSVFFSFAPSGTVNDAAAVSFDTYHDNPTLVDRVVFRGDGTIDSPQAAISQRPSKPAVQTTTVPLGSINCNPGQRCRGIYISDSSATGDVPNRNTFRISVDDFVSTGRPSQLKWVPSPAGGNRGEINYVPPPWRWVD